VTRCYEDGAVCEPNLMLTTIPLVRATLIHGTAQNVATILVDLGVNVQAVAAYATSRRHRTCLHAAARFNWLRHKRLPTRGSAINPPVYIRCGRWTDVRQ